MTILNDIETILTNWQEKVKEIITQRLSKNIRKIWGKHGIVLNLLLGSARPPRKVLTTWKEKETKKPTQQPWLTL